MAKQTQEEKRENELRKVRLDKMEALREKGVNPFGQRFERTHHAQDVLEHAEELIASGEEVIIAGRLMAAPSSRTPGTWPPDRISSQGALCTCGRTSR